MQRQGVDRDVVPLARYADEDGPALRLGELIGGLDHPRVARCLDSHVRTRRADDVADRLVEIGRGLRVDAVAGTEALRHLELAGRDVDRDDRVGRHHLRRLHDAQADPSDAEHDHGLADLDLGIVVDDPYRSSDGAAEERRQPGVEIRWDRGQPVLGDDRVVVEGGHPTRVHGLAVPPIGRRLRLDASTQAPVHHDLVRPLHRRYAFARLEYGGAALVAEQVGEKPIRALGPVDLIDLRAADPAVVDLDEHLPEAQTLGGFDLRQLQRRLLLDQDRRVDSHRKHGDRFIRSR